MNKYEENKSSLPWWVGSTLAQLKCFECWEYLPLLHFAKWALSAVSRSVQCVLVATWHFTTAKAHFQVQQGVEIEFSKVKSFSSSYHCFSIDYWELSDVKLLGLLSGIDMWDLLLQKSLARFEPLTCGAEHRSTPLKLKAELHHLH